MALVSTGNFYDPIAGAFNDVDQNIGSEHSTKSVRIRANAVSKYSDSKENDLGKQISEIYNRQKLFPSDLNKQYARKQPLSEVNQAPLKSVLKSKSNKIFVEKTESQAPKVAKELAPVSDIKVEKSKMNYDDINSTVERHLQNRFDYTKNERLFVNHCFGFEISFVNRSFTLASF